MYTIREMDINDYEKTLELWTSTEGMGLSESDSKEAIAVFLERNLGHSFVCLDADEIIGSILCGHDGRRGFFYHAAVSTQYRSKGIGKRLIQHALATLKAAGIMKCHLMVYSDHLSGHRFWEHEGWVKREDVLLFSKDI